MTACIPSNGTPSDRYGLVWDPETKRTWRAHRLAWKKARGPIPKGLSVLHRCDNPRCRNVEHLFLGTQRENVYDAISKGRMPFKGRTPEERREWERTRKRAYLAKPGVREATNAQRRASRL